MAGARAVLKSVLQDFPKADISVSLVWIQMPGFNDNVQTAKRIAGTMMDPRVKHFYDPFPDHRAGKAFAKGLLKQGPAWDIYFFYEKGAEWKGGPPDPAEWMHQLGGGDRADARHFHWGQDLVDKLHEAMHAVAGEDCSPLP
ncbi:MAG: hypothetical protein IID41_03900 [Planctomycetes bacterium]|nr:hypothetical protein [Planctomycetota bacterium]